MSAAQPFSPRAVLSLVVAGAVSFVALLYAIGSGLSGQGNDGGNHVLSKGLTGYSALAALLEARGILVVRSRDTGRLDDPGLLVLTPPHEAEAARLREAIDARRRIGPTLLVLPKWQTVLAPGAGAKPGWVQTIGSRRSLLAKAYDEHLDTALGPIPRADFGSAGGVAAIEEAGAVQTLTIAEDAALPIVRGSNGKVLAAYLNDDGVYPALDDWSGWGAPDRPDRGLFPVIIVAEPDLLDNRGLADRRTALNALALVRRVRPGNDTPVVFDATLNGLGRSRNLLTLAFTPPFLAATLALLLAAFAAGWRALARFGPPRLAARQIAFGKTALVENSAGLIRRAGRIRLLGAPYAALVAQRLARSLGLPPNAPVEAIDAAQTRRGLPGARFSGEAAALSAARRPHELVRHAAALHAIERTLNDRARPAR